MELTLVKLLFKEGTTGKGHVTDKKLDKVIKFLEWSRRVGDVRTIIESTIHIKVMSSSTI